MNNSQSLYAEKKTEHGDASPCDEEQVEMGKFEDSADDEDEESLNMTAVDALRSLASSASMPSGDEKEEAEFKIPQRFTRSGRRRAVSFPLKLMKVLSMKEYHDIIAWTPSGKSFLILNSKTFALDILPHHFKTAKYSSFTRKLHRWGFSRHYRGEEAGAFYHEDFQKNNPDLIETMTCYKQEPTKVSVSAPVTTPLETVKRTSSSISLPAQTVESLPVFSSQRVESQPVFSLEGERRMTFSMQSTQGLPTGFPTPTPTMVRPTPSAADINAVIELEVARRIQERLDAAALENRAWEIMQQEQQRKISSLLNPTIPSRRSAQQLAWSQQGINLLKNSSHLPSFMMLQQPYKKQDAHPLLRFRAQASDVPSLPSLPRTNISGAKTA